MLSPAHGADRALRASRLFQHFDEGLLASLASTAVRRSLARGDTLWRAGTHPAHFTVIVVGLVKIVRRKADGTDSIVAVFGPRESIGDAAVLSGITYPADAVAASDAVDVLLVETAAVLSAMRTQPAITQALNQSLLDHTKALHEKIRIMSAGSVPKRLATLLLHLADRFGDETAEGTTFVPVQLSRTELAGLVGATMETTIRTMCKWQKDGAVSTTDDGFEIHDPASLLRFLEQ